MRKSLIAMAAVAALGAATMTGAMAGPPGGGHGGGGMGRGGGGGGMGHAMSGGGMGHAMNSGGMGAASGGMHANNIGGANIGRPAVAGANIGGAANVGHANVGTTNFATVHGTQAGRGRYADRDHDRHGRRNGGFGVGLYAFGGPDYYDYYDSDSDTDNCYQRHLVRTPFGLRWRTIDICD